MAASQRREASQRTANDMLKRGIYHGKRQTSPRHNNYPSLQDIGSAAYKRRLAVQGG